MYLLLSSWNTHICSYKSIPKTNQNWTIWRQRHLKSPQSLLGISLYLTSSPKVTVMVMNDWQCNYTFPFQRHSYLKFDLENLRSRSWPGSKLMATMESYCSIVYFYHFVIIDVCFLFCGNRTIFGWDIANSIFDLENSKSRSWPGQTGWSHSIPVFQSMFAFCFMAIWPFLAET